MDEFLDDEGKLGHGFKSVDALEEIDIGDGYRQRPKFISAKLDPEYKQELVKLLKEYKDCFVWEYYEMLAWIDLLLNIGCLLNLGIGHFSRV
jgi:hypothetical protein